MNNIMLYTMTVLIWGSTWIGIKFQLGEVDPAYSVSYRFLLASLLLFIWCYWMRYSLRFSLRHHRFIVLLGICLFGVNYVLFYIASEHITSGLVAVSFATISIMNMLNGVIFMRLSVSIATLAAAVLGLVGIGLVFMPELKSLSLDDSSVKGLLLCLLATYSASLGNIISARNQREGLPIMSVNAFAMAYGAVLTLIYALLSGIPISISWQLAYWLSLGYLTVFGSIIAFGCYLTLVGRIGPSRAAYAGLLFPLVALAISTIVEDYQWTPQSLLGVSLILLGNIWILWPQRKRA